MKLLIRLLTILGFHATLSNAFNIFDIFENGNGREFGEGQNQKTSTESIVEADCKKYQCKNMRCVEAPSDCGCPPLYVKTIRHGTVMCVRSDQQEI